MLVQTILLTALLRAPSAPESTPSYDAPIAVTRGDALRSEGLTTHLPTIIAVDTPVVRRPLAVEYSDDYYTRLTIHRIGSYTMIPLFVAEYSLGENLINDASPAGWIKPSHVAVASGIGVLFTVNTVTGLWNLWDSRHDETGRTRRTVHSVMMLLSDAGFTAAAALAPSRDHGFADASTYQHRVNVHRGVAIGSFALSTVGGAMMWFWKQ
jgi:hypothetical protein